MVADFQKLTAKDGISESEANLLATLYFAAYDGGCGFATHVVRQGNWWVADTLVGPTGGSDQPIRIHVKFGWVNQKGRPISRPPWLDLKKMIASEPETQPTNK